MNVYIVTQGHYSDYIILAVFLGEEAAERFAAKQNLDPQDNNAVVETWTVTEEKDEN